MTDNDSKLNEFIKETDDYYILIEFTKSTRRFTLLNYKTEQEIRQKFIDAYDETLGICDECNRTNGRCNCRTRWDRYDYDDDEYDRYHDR